MLRSAVSKAMWVAKGMALFWGAVMTLALLLGAGSVALAAVPGDPFKLGRANAINALTQLTGTANNALLKIENDGKGPNATALELETDPKKPPMRVNSLAQVENLHADLLDGRNASQFANGLGDGTAVEAANADKLDGKDSAAFLPVETYSRSNSLQTPPGQIGTIQTRRAKCDDEDVLLGGGFFGDDQNDVVLSSAPGEDFLTREEEWFVKIKDNGTNSDLGAEAICADFPPLKQ